MTSYDITTHPIQYIYTAVHSIQYTYLGEAEVEAHWEVGSEPVELLGEGPWGGVVLGQLVGAD